MSANDGSPKSVFVYLLLEKRHVPEYSGISLYGALKVKKKKTVKAHFFRP